MKSNTFFDSIRYVNLGYLLSQIGGFFISPQYNKNSCLLLGNTPETLKSMMEEINPDSKIKWLVVDMDGITPTWHDEEKKTSWMQIVFEGVVEKGFEGVLFANCDEDTANMLIEKDFPDSNKVLVLSFDYETDCLKPCKNATTDGALGEFNKNVTDNNITYNDFIPKLISERVKKILSENECIRDVTVFKEHILFSTSVHVNKYVNLKPVLEKHVFFQEVCYLLYRHIYNTFHAYPDYVVASSRNSIYIASGLLNYFQTVDMIIVDQVSPVTRLSNFSNLEDIKPNRKYAIIEDFFCMGTEIKTVRSVLWSRGVDVDQYCYAFPIVSTSLHGNETQDKLRSLRVYPLHILDGSENYLMFTNNCCPVCNELDCKHKDAFKIKMKEQ